MAIRQLPHGVTAYTGTDHAPGTYVLTNTDGSILTDASGNTYAGNTPRWWETALPYLVGAGMTIQQLLNLVSPGTNPNPLDTSQFNAQPSTPWMGNPVDPNINMLPTPTGTNYLPSLPRTTPTGPTGTTPNTPSSAPSGNGLPNIPGLPRLPGSNQNSSQSGAQSLLDWLSMIPTGAAAANSFRSPAAEQGLQDMMGLATNRVKQNQPLHDALQAMAMAGLPNYAKGGQ